MGATRKNGFESTVLHNEDGLPIAVVLDGAGRRRLAVDVTANIEVGDVQIGAVELDDGDGAFRASIKPDGTALSAAPNDGGVLIAGSESSTTQRHIAVDASGRLIVVAPAGGIAAAIAGQTQVHTTETVAALGAGAAFTMAAGRDQNTYEAFGISVFVDAAAGNALDVDVLIENSLDNATFRTVDTINLAAGAGLTATLNRVYATTRRYFRVTVTNNDGANALDATELVTTQKPIG